MGRVDTARLADYITRTLSRIPSLSLAPDTPLISSGLLDSVSLIQVLAFIEDEFEVTIPDQFITAEGMDSVASIVQLADTHGQSAPGRRFGPGAINVAATLRDAILQHFRHDPGQEYVRCHLPDGSSASVTYGDLVRRGRSFAAAFAASETSERSVIVILLPHGPDLYCAFFGAVLSNRIPTLLPVPSFKLNREHYQQELRALLARLGARAIVTDARLGAELGFAEGRLDDARLVPADDLPDAGDDEGLFGQEVSADDTILLQHSSGSTGLKKTVALSNRTVMRQVSDYASVLRLREGDRIATWLPLYHDMGLVACTILPAVLGVPVSALGALHWVTNPASLLRIIAQDRCTLAWMPNFAYDFLATSVRRSQLESVRLEHMRGWINCSEPTLATSHRRFAERFASIGVAPETLWTCYAMAETTFAVSQSSAGVPPRVELVDRECFLGSGEASAARQGFPTMELMSAGELIPNTEVRIVNDAGEDLPERRVGEIAIRSASLFSGYFLDFESTARDLRDGWYYSGDLGYLADGHLFVTGRKKDVIIVAGRNFYPQDIERIVSDVPGIYPGRVVALGLDDPSLGTQRLIVLAEVEPPASEADPDLEREIRARVSERLDCVIDDLRLLPHMWLLKTSSGKIARRPNLQRYLEELRHALGSVAAWICLNWLTIPFSATFGC
jgi:fatty-acyl-CoA synthase